MELENGVCCLCDSSTSVLNETASEEALYKFIKLLDKESIDIETLKANCKVLRVCNSCLFQLDILTKHNEKIKNTKGKRRHAKECHVCKSQDSLIKINKELAEFQNKLKLFNYYKQLEVPFICCNYCYNYFEVLYRMVNCIIGKHPELETKQKQRMIKLPDFTQHFKHLNSLQEDNSTSYVKSIKDDFKLFKCIPIVRLQGYKIKVNKANSWKGGPLSERLRFEREQVKQNTKKLVIDLAREDLLKLKESLASGKRKKRKSVTFNESINVEISPPSFGRANYESKNESLDRKTCLKTAYMNSDDEEDDNLEPVSYSISSDSEEDMEEQPIKRMSRKRITTGSLQILSNVVLKKARRDDNSEDAQNNSDLDKENPQENLNEEKGATSGRENKVDIELNNENNSEDTSLEKQTDNIKESSDQEIDKEKKLEEEPMEVIEESEENKKSESLIKVGDMEDEALVKDICSSPKSKENEKLDEALISTEIQNKTDNEAKETENILADENRIVLSESEEIVNLVLEDEVQLKDDKKDEIFEVMDSDEENESTNREKGEHNKQDLIKNSKEKENQMDIDKKAEVTEDTNTKITLEESAIKSNGSANDATEKNVSKEEEQNEIDMEESPENKEKANESCKIKNDDVINDEVNSNLEAKNEEKQKARNESVENKNNEKQVNISEITDAESIGTTNKAEEKSDKIEKECKTNEAAQSAEEEILERTNESENKNKETIEAETERNEQKETNKDSYKEQKGGDCVEKIMETEEENSKNESNEIENSENLANSHEKDAVKESSENEINPSENNTNKIDTVTKITNDRTNLNENEGNENKQQENETETKESDKVIDDKVISAETESNKTELNTKECSEEEQKENNKESVNLSIEAISKESPKDPNVSLLLELEGTNEEKKIEQEDNFPNNFTQEKSTSQLKSENESSNKKSIVLESQVEVATEGKENTDNINQLMEEIFGNA